METVAEAIESRGRRLSSASPTPPPAKSECISVTTGSFDGKLSVISAYFIGKGPILHLLDKLIGNLKLIPHHLSYPIEITIHSHMHSSIKRFAEMIGQVELKFPGDSNNLTTSSSSIEFFEIDPWKNAMSSAMQAPNTRFQ